MSDRGVEASRTRVLLTSACLAMLAINVDFFSLNLALPSMARALDTTTTNLQWAISAQLIAWWVPCSSASRRSRVGSPGAPSS